MLSEATERPLFVVSSERSGTTVLSLMLAHHPELAWAGELDYAVTRLPDGGGFPDVDAYCDDILADRMFYSLGLSVDRRLSYPELVRSFLEQRRMEQGKRLVGATVHTDFHKLPRLFRDATYVHLVRDGRDVASSCIRMGWAGNMWTAPERWIRAEEQWAQLSKGLPAERSLVVRYEDLIRHPERTLGRIVATVGLAFHPEMLRYSERSTYEPPDRSLVHRWKRDLSAREVRLVEARIGEMLRERGYRLSGHAPRSVSPMERALLLAHDKLERTRVRYRTYGPHIAAAELLTRRFGLDRLHRPIRRRMDMIETSMLK